MFSELLVLLTYTKKNVSLPWIPPFCWHKVEAKTPYVATIVVWFAFCAMAKQVVSWKKVTVPGMHAAMDGSQVTLSHCGYRYDDPEQTVAWELSPGYGMLSLKQELIT